MSPIAIGAFAPEAMLPATPHGIDEQRRLARKSPLEVAREFEAVLVAQVIGAMRKTVASTGGLFGDGGANKILDGAFDQELARSIAKDARLGLAEELAAQIERHEHAASVAAADAGVGDVSGGALHPPAANSPVHASARVAAADTAAASALGAIVPEDDTVAQLVAGADGRVTSGFGVRRDPITGAHAFHGGIDVAAPRGSAVYAAVPGEVVFSGRRGRAGNVVEVRQGELVTTYAHVQRALVRAGQKVAVGDVLATVGSTGRSTGPHVHVAVTREGQVVDPATVLGTSENPSTAAPAPPDAGGEA